MARNSDTSKRKQGRSRAPAKFSPPGGRTRVAPNEARMDMGGRARTADVGRGGGRSGAGGGDEARARSAARSRRGPARAQTPTRARKR
jgi:hypothetical protein